MVRQQRALATHGLLLCTRIRRGIHSHRTTYYVESTNLLMTARTFKCIGERSYRFDLSMENVAEHLPAVCAFVYVALPKTMVS